jgi:SHS2 domain-containing protein
MNVALWGEKCLIFNGILLTMNVSEGFREHAHTADWELEVWASTLSGLLNQAALGMQSLSGMRLTDDSRKQHQFSLDAPDAESLLVRFLNELLWLAEQEKLGFVELEIEVSGHGASVAELTKPIHLDVRMIGAPIAGLDKEIKAVTYHNLAVLQTGNGLSAHIVFDV